MTNLTVPEFLEVVKRSQLIEHDDLVAALANCKTDGNLPAEASELADCLRAQGHVSHWQQKKLLQGKSKQFFLGDYCLVDHLGSGGMSRVYLAKHKLINRQVAIKVLPQAKVDVGSYLSRFEREARATSRLSHPHVVRVFDLDCHGTTHFMVMEYVPGRDLKAMIRAEGPMALEQAALYIAQAADGLAHAHARGLVHRDIKPANMIVNDNGVLKILDLGLARVFGDELSSLTIKHDENMMGTADYQAPEQARDAHHVDARADIYSLGCTFYYLLAGHAPFTEGTIAQRLLMHQNQVPDDIRAIRPDCPHALADLCMTMLAKAPEQRIQSADIVASRLRRWLQRQAPATLKSAPTSREVHASTATPTGPGIPIQPAGSSTNVPVDSRDPLEESLVKQRQARARRPTNVPRYLWILLGSLVAVCVALIIVIIRRNL